MIDITITHDLDRLQKQLDLSAQELLRATTRAINRTMTSVRASGARDLGGIYPGIKLGLIKSRIAMQRASAARNVGVLGFSGKRFRLFGNWVQTQTKNGVRLGRRRPWRIETLDGRVVDDSALAHAFIQRGKRTGRPNVWVRVGAQRYPITALLGSSLAEAFKGKNIGEHILAISRERFGTVLEQEANFALLKRV